MSLDSVLLTGATGNLGATILAHLMETSSTVKVVLRSASKSQSYLEHRYAAAVAIGKLTFVEISDMTLPGVFDVPAASVSSIMHVASPIPSADDLHTPIATSDDIMLNILSAATQSNTVRRVIVTGSIVSCIRIPQDIFSGIEISDLSWNAITEAEAYADPGSAYAYTKVTAEKAAWTYISSVGGPAFDVVFLLVPLIIGRSVHEDNAPTKDSLGGQSAIYREMIDRETPGFVFPYFMDIEDVARVHLVSLQITKVPGNERYLFHAPQLLSGNAIARMIHESESGKLSQDIKSRVAKSDGGVDIPPHLFSTNTYKADKVFGTHWIGARESVEADIWGILESSPK